jgi:hypothetical protein
MTVELANSVANRFSSFDQCLCGLVQLPNFARGKRCSGKSPMYLSLNFLKVGEVGKLDHVNGINNLQATVDGPVRAHLATRGAQTLILTGARA